MRALRWLLVVPGALLAGFAVTFPIHFGVVLFLRVNDFLSFLPAEGLERFMYALVVPYVWVVVGASIAPAHRTYTAVALAVLVVLLMAWTVAVLLPSAGMELAGPTWLHVLTVIAQAISIALAVYKVRTRSRLALDA